MQLVEDSRDKVVLDKTKWRGAQGEQVFVIQPHGGIRFTGYPIFIIARDGVARFATREETYAIMDIHLISPDTEG